MIRVDFMAFGLWKTYKNQIVVLDAEIREGSGQEFWE